MNEKVLIVDDEKSILDILTYALKKEGYNIERAYDGQEALDKIKTFQPQIIILDLMMPKVSGYDVCKKIQDEEIGIIMLTAKNDIVDKLLGLELGADDYLTKPFDIREVIARVKSLARRFKKATPAPSPEISSDILTVSGLILNPKQRSVTIENSKIDFTSKEFELLYLMLSNANIVYTRDNLLNLIWDMEYFGGTRTVDTHIQRIRKKLGEHYQNVIVTVHGVGYKGVVELNENRY